MQHSLLALTQTATPEAAVVLQQELRTLVVRENDFGVVKTVAGVDVGFEEDDRVACAANTTWSEATAVLRFPDLTLQESIAIRRPTTFPYVPGLLAFREVPVVMEALAELKTRPDLLLCDGNGYIHPRRCGFACHLGIVSDLPSIGVAKKPYLGEHEPLAEHQGAWQPIRDDGEVIGAIVRTQSNIKPVYVSIGHRISLNSAFTPSGNCEATEFVLQCAPKYRLPETTRQADQLSKGHTKPVSAI